MNDVRDLRSDSPGGHSQSGEELIPVLYEELRKLAAARIANDPAGTTLQATALVHEAWLRLTGGEGQHWQGRGHFFAAAAEAMRRILIDRARRKQAIKRGAEKKRIDLEHLDLAETTDDETLLRIDEALEKLAKEDREAARLVTLRFFVGLNYAEAAEALGVSERTAKRLWTFARVWLYRELSPD